MFSIDSVLIVASLTLLILWIWDYRRWRRQLPPGPPCFPLIGNFGQINVRDEVHTFRRDRKLYGDVFCYVIGSQTTIVINGLTAIHDLIVKMGDAFTDRPEMSVIRRMNNDLGLFAIIRDMWKEHRSFAFRAIKGAGSYGHSVEDIIRMEVKNFLDDLSKSNEKAIDPTEILNLRFVSILRWLIFGKHIEDENDKERYQRLLSLIREMVVDPSFLGIGLYIRIAERLPGDPFGTKRRKETNTKMVRILQEEIDICKKTSKVEKSRSYVDAYIEEQGRQASNSESTFTDKQLVHSVRDLIVAGIDTTVTSLKWALVYLINNPTVQQNMRSEIHRAVGTTRLPCTTDKQNLPYCTAVLNESLRVCHVFPVPPSRCANFDVKWKNYTIPRGAMVLINLESVAKDPEVFPNPESFDPNRFLNDDGTFNTAKTIFPFSAGKRNCLGEGIARMELFLFMTSLVQRFQLLPETDDNLPSTEPIMFATRFPKEFKARFVDIK